MVEKKKKSNFFPLQPFGSKFQGNDFFLSSSPNEHVLA